MRQLQVRSLYLVFFLSGFCGLIYESIWSHYLKLVVGHAAYAQAVVLVVFVGGMALGAWLASLWSHRLRSPILAYAAIEAAVALVAFGFHEVFIEASGWALDWLLPTACQAEGACIATWLLAGALILPGAVLLGSTFPLMSAGILRLGVPTGRGLSLLYFLNSAGAALGVLASGFVFIPALGLQGTLLAAGALNTVVALGAWLALNLRGAGQPAPTTAPTPGGMSTTNRWLLAIACITGLSSFIYEVVWIRMLTLVLGAATHSFELMLASFIFGLALGGWWVRDRIDTQARPERLLAAVQIAMGVLAVATLPLYSWCFEAMAFTLHGVARTAQGYELYMGLGAAMAMVVILPATFCAGMTLPLVTAVLLRRGGGEREIGRVYSANTLGAILGVLVTVYWLMPAVGLKWALAVGAALDIALGAAILWSLPRDRSRLRGLVVAAAAVVLAVIVAQLVPLKAEQMASGVYRSGASVLNVDNKVLFHRDGRTSTVTVLEHKSGTRGLVTNGKPEGTTFTHIDKATADDRTVVMLGALGPAHHPKARRAAVVGMGTGITSSVLLRSGNLESVDTIEIEPMVLEAAPLFRPRNAQVLDDPRSHIVIDDARAHLARAQAGWDLVVSEPSNPWVSGVSGLFTTEFYEQVARKLAPGGHFVQWLQLYETSPEMVSAIIRAFSASFPDYKVYATNAADVLLVGRADGGRVELSPDVFAHAGRAAELRRIGITNIAMLTAHEADRAGMVQVLAQSWGSPPNSDFFPYVDNRAARDRFMRTDALALFQMDTAPLPFLEFRRPAAPFLGAIHDAHPEMPRKVSDLAGSWHGARLLRGEPLAEAERRHLAPYARDYELVRGWLWGCQPLTHPAMWDSALTVAREINTGLHPRQADALWNEAATGRCARSFGPEQLLWVQLFQAVGARDAERARALADRLLAQPAFSLRQQEYLLLAAVGSRLALGQQQEARELFGKLRTTLPIVRMETPWFRYLREVLSLKARAA